MFNFDNGVPFDPGFSRFTISFFDNIAPVLEELDAIKSPHQKKFKLNMVEPHIHKLINNCAAFYLGCLLWAGYISCKFADNPKKIINNPLHKLTKEEIENLDYNEEINFMLETFVRLNRDYKYFVQKPFAVDEHIIHILNTYNEFVSLNNNFADIQLTSDIKLPKTVEHFTGFDNERLESLYSNITEAIESGNIEKLLKLNFMIKSFHERC